MHVRLFSRLLCLISAKTRGDTIHALLTSLKQPPIAREWPLAGAKTSGGLAVVAGFV